MRKRLKLTKIFVLLLLVATLVMYTTTKDNNSKGIIIKNEFNNNISFNEEYSGVDFLNYEDIITDFLNLYYKSIYYLEENDFSKFYKQDSDEGFLFNKSISYLINTRKLEKNDLSLINASYDLEFLSIEENDNESKIIVNENQNVQYSFMSSSSNYYNIENVFIFDKDKNLKSYRRNQDFNTLFTENLKADFTKEDVNKLYNSLLLQKELQLEENNTMYSYYLENKNYEYEKCDYEYNRAQAEIYLNKYITIRNSDDWDVYDDYGGNCQNFASQVLHEGGIPMDTVGDYIWKWYGSTPNNLSIKTGRSPSWTIVSDFYNYAKNNKGFGLCADTDANLYYAEPGDIMQVGNNSLYFHSIVVSGIVKSNNELIDILVNSNTNDYKNVPISSLATTEIRLIKILGYNE